MATGTLLESTLILVCLPYSYVPAALIQVFSHNLFDVVAGDLLSHEINGVAIDTNKSVATD